MTTDIIEIDANKAVELLTWAVEQLGADARYEAPAEVHGICVYVDPGTSSCSCIVAHALHHAGMTIEELRVLDTQNYGAVITASRAVLPERVSITESARDILGAAQEIQDSGRTFGDALAGAAIVAGNGSDR